MSAGITFQNTIADNANGASALTVTGTGGVNLRGANSYTGQTNVDGVLTMISAGSINSSSGIVIAGNTAEFLDNSTTQVLPSVTLETGTLGGTGTVQTVTVANGMGGVISSGDGAGGTQTLTIGSLTFAGAATVDANTAGTGVAPIAVTGALSTNGANGPVTLGGGGVFTLGLNNLISFGSFTSGSLGDFAMGNFAGLNGHQIATGLVLNGNDIAVNVIGDTPVWTGSNGGIWTTGVSGTVGSTPAWALKTAHTPTDFWLGDSVEFNDSVNVNGTYITPATTTVTIRGGSVTPGAVTFNNSLLNYSVITGDGVSGIAAGSLTKNGSGVVSISTPNTYSGATAINGGSFDLVNGGQLAGTAITVGTGATFAEDFASSVTGAASLTNLGTTQISGNNSYTGATTLSSGTLSIVSAGEITNTAVTVAPGATLNVVNGDIGGTSSITSGGITSISSAVDYSGATAVTSGTFSVLNGGTLEGAGTGITVSPGATFVAAAGSSTVNGGFLTTGGNSTLNGDWGFTGGTLVTAGVLNIGGFVDNSTITVGGTTGYTVTNLNSGSSIGEDASGLLATNLGIINQKPNTSVFVNIMIVGCGETGIPTITYANYNMTGGILTVNGNNRFRVGQASGAGTESIMYVSGASQVSSNIGMELNDTSGSTAGTGGAAVYYMTGGSLTDSAPTMSLGLGGRLGQSEMTITGSAAVMLTGSVAFGGSVAGTIAAGDANRVGILNLGTGASGGGMLTTTNLAQSTVSSPVGYLNLNGGTLKAANTSSSFVSGLTQATVFSGGGTIDNGGNTIAIPQPLVAPSGQGLINISVAGATGYLGVPYVQITGGGAATPATAVANLDAHGNVTSITITNPGTGYASAPTVTLVGGGGSAGTLGATVALLTGGGITFDSSGGVAATTGTTALTGAETYTGATNVNSTTLIVGRPISATASVGVGATGILEDDSIINPAATVTSAGTVEGQGTLGPIDINAGGTLAPGDTAAGNLAGTLTANGNVILTGSTSIFSIRLGVASAGDSDQLLDSLGSISLGGATLNLMLGSSYASQAVGTTYVIVNGGAATTGSAGNTFAQGFTIVASDGDFYNILYGVTANGSGRGNDVVLLRAVPEPGDVALVLGGMGILGFWWRLRSGRRG
jgi:autotransporter-associated beta strand protein